MRLTIVLVLACLLQGCSHISVYTTDDYPINRRPIHGVTVVWHEEVRL